SMSEYIGEEILERTVREQFRIGDDASIPWLWLGARPMDGNAFRTEVERHTAGRSPFTASDRIVYLVDVDQHAKNRYRRHLQGIREALGPKVGVLFLACGELGAEANVGNKLQNWKERIASWRDANVWIEFIE